MLADLVIVPENPLSNLKVLYGTGNMRLNPQTNRQEKIGGVKYTIKDGIVYDAQKLLAEVAAAVAPEKRTVRPPPAQRWREALTREGTQGGSGPQAGCRDGAPFRKDCTPGCRPKKH